MYMYIVLGLDVAALDIKEPKNVNKQHAQDQVIIIPSLLYLIYMMM